MTAPDDDPHHHVGNDVAARAALRYSSATTFKPEFVDKLLRRIDRIDASRECIVCHWFPKGDGAWRRSTVGGRDVAVCDRCSSLALISNLLTKQRVQSALVRSHGGKGLCQLIRQSQKDAIKELRSCITLLAINVERACGQHLYDATGRLMSLSGQLSRIQQTFRLDWYATVCNCPAHVAARVPRRSGTYTKPDPGVHDVDGLLPDPDDPTRPYNYLEIIRSFPDKIRYRGEVVDRTWLVAKLEKAKKGKALKGGKLAKANRTATAHPGLLPGGLAERAVKAATQTNAAKWQAIHQWEREHAAQHPAFAGPKKPDPIVLDDPDVDLLTKAFSRDPGDLRFYCDFCGDFHAVMKMPTGVFICAACRLDGRIQRLVPIVEAVRQGKPVKWFDHKGYPDE